MLAIRAAIPDRDPTASGSGRISQGALSSQVPFKGFTAMAQIDSGIAHEAPSVEPGRL